jgi:hypothetical protein
LLQQPRIPPSVSLGTVTHAMDDPVYLNAQLGLVAIEIQNVRPERVLPAYFRPVKRRGPQLSPEQRLRKS